MTYEQNWHDVIINGNLNVNQLNSMNSNSPVTRGMERNRDNAPVEVSDFTRFVSSFDIQIDQYRFLDDDNTPVTLLIAEPVPDNVLNGHNNATRQEEQSVNGYTLTQGISYMDLHAREPRQQSESRKIEVDARPGEEGQYLSQLWLKGKDHDTVTFFSEIYTTLQHEPDRKYLIGLVSEDVGIKSGIDGNMFAISDIVLGSTGHNKREIRNKKIGLLSGHKISKKDNLQVYIEAYNFDVKKDGSVYQIQYSLEPASRRTRQAQGSPVSLVWQSNTMSPMDFQFFEVELENIPPGDYRLTLTLSETQSGRTAKGTAPVEITR